MAGSIAIDSTIQLLSRGMFENSFKIEHDAHDTITPVVYLRGAGFLLSITAITIKGVVFAESLIAYAMRRVQKPPRYDKN